MDGYFVTFEGGEGAGKSSILEAAASMLSDKGYDVLTTREPGGIEIAEKIRQVILDKTHTSMDARTESLLYAAARRQHLVEKILPALDKGKIVLCDRFIDSSLAYQGYARGIGVDDVYRINQFAIQDAFPDMTLFLTLSRAKDWRALRLMRTGKETALTLRIFSSMNRFMRPISGLSHNHRNASGLLMRISRTNRLRQMPYKSYYQVYTRIQRRENSEISYRGCPG